jgi:hypothetical protein
MASAISGMAIVAVYLGERFGSGDGERKTLLTRQIAFEPLPASVLLNLFADVAYSSAGGESANSAA